VVAEGAVDPLVKFYHCTSLQAAAEIEVAGFIDATGSYGLVGAEVTGVWIADCELDCNAGVDNSSAAFELEIDESSVEAFEVIEEGKGYREWIVPAVMLNKAPRRRIR
jgi:hypothetical protein